MLDDSGSDVVIGRESEAVGKLPEIQENKSNL